MQDISLQGPGLDTHELVQTKPVVNFVDAAGNKHLSEQRQTTVQLQTNIISGISVGWPGKYIPGKDITNQMLCLPKGLWRDKQLDGWGLPER